MYNLNKHIVGLSHESSHMCKHSNRLYGTLQDLRHAVWPSSPGGVILRILRPHGSDSQDSGADGVLLGSAVPGVVATGILLTYTAAAASA